MASHEIVPLKCPSCGSSSTGPSTSLAFGAEFSCAKCGCTSVLIVNRALLQLDALQKSGERVCISCGRVAQREARFCQGGHALVRQCIKCLKEFSVDHNLCDFCAWPQNVKPGTAESETLAFDRAISELASPSYQALGYALKEICKGSGTAPTPARRAAVSAIHNLMVDPSFLSRSLVGPEYNFTERDCWSALGCLGPEAVDTVCSLMRDPTFCRSRGDYNEGLNATDFWSLDALRKLGPAARQVLPEVRRRMEDIWASRWESHGWWHQLFQCLAAISPDDALDLCSRSLEEDGGRISDRTKQAVLAAFSFGKDAIPMLEKFGGAFSGVRGQYCKAAIKALRSGQSGVNLNDI